MTGAIDLLNRVGLSAEAGKHKRHARVALAAILLLLGGMNLGNLARLVAQQPTSKLQRFEQTEVHMGSPFKIVFYSDNEKLANRAFERAFQRISQLDKALSDYDLESETNRICASAPHATPQAISTELFKALELSANFTMQTDGAFDVTVGPLTKLWRRARRQKEMPDKKLLSEALAAVGMESIKLDAAQSTVQLTKPGIRLDFGGIGQGYAADEVLRILSEMGIRQALVNASGDVVALDPPPGEKGWKVALAGPQPKTKPPTTFVWLSNAAITTSGDAFQSVEIDGNHYSHIVDPKTGLGSDRRIAATCCAPNGAAADALATALGVLPTKKGLEMLARKFPEAQALVVELKGDEVVETATAGFPQRQPIASGESVE